MKSDFIKWPWIDQKQCHLFIRFELQAQKHAHQVFRSTFWGNDRQNVSSCLPVGNTVDTFNSFCWHFSHLVSNTVDGIKWIFELCASQPPFKCTKLNAFNMQFYVLYPKKLNARAVQSRQYQSPTTLKID